MKLTTKVKRWVKKHLGAKTETYSVPRPKSKSKQPAKKKAKVKKVDYPVRRQSEPSYQYQPEPIYHSRKESNTMKYTALLAIVIVGGLGALVWWLQTYVSDTAALVALAMIGMFVFYVVKDLMDNLKLKQHNESQRITAEMLTEFNRNDAMTDNYRQRTTIENARLTREQLKIERQREVEQLRLQQQQTQNQQWANQDEYDYEDVEYKVYE